MTTTNEKMVSKLPLEFRKFHCHKKQIQHILDETQRVLETINLNNFFPDENIVEELMPQKTLDKVRYIIGNAPAIVILGQNNNAKASLINNIFDTDILPVSNSVWRWVRITYGLQRHISLSLGLEYEVVEKLQAHTKPWDVIPIEDLTASGSEDINCPTVLDVKLDQSILQDDVQMFVVPHNGVTEILSKGSLGILPIFLYALGEEPLTEQNLEELRDLKETFPYNPILFISSLINMSLDSFVNTELTESEQHSRENLKLIPIDNNEFKSDNVNIDKMNSIGLTWIQQLKSVGFFGIEQTVEVHKLTWLFNNGQYVNSKNLVDSCKEINRIECFTRNCLEIYLVTAGSYLNDVHTICLRKFILSAFDMARKMQITPKRIQYVEKKEDELYNSLMKVVNEQQEELSLLIQNIIQEMKDDVMTSTSDIFQSQTAVDGNEGIEWTARVVRTEVQRYVLSCLGEKVAKQLVNSVNCLRETFVGTLQRCLISLEKSYEHDNNPLASDALKQILSTAYNIELHNSPPTLLSFLAKVRQLFKSLPLLWTPTPTVDADWKKKIVIDVLNSLSASRLAKTTSTQFREKLKSSHEMFLAAMRSLDNYYSGNLERTEEQRVAIRKQHAPALARLALESMSLIDMIRYGVPQYSKEIGRGQYGVVFACEGWAGAPGLCAIKSVVPPDERHWNDLAMEVYYTRSIPDHKRIVKLRGSVIDPSYGAGFGLGAAVLLITDRLSRDLYCGLRAGLSWLERIQIAIDVLEAIRFLHSQGLVHRDIKLKNVLLDTENRAKVTDLGFCITEAMMSGSVVGTPIHMAPELLCGQYDSSVDIYAFGILFWYICAGSIQLPTAYEHFHSKEQLWVNVRKGLRPERLVRFDRECWMLMEQCWAGEPSKRPLLGAIQPVLESIQVKAERGKSLQQMKISQIIEDPEPPSELSVQSDPALALAKTVNQRGSRPKACSRPKCKICNLVKPPCCQKFYTKPYGTYPIIHIPMPQL